MERGVVRWFNTTKGYGLIRSDSRAVDVLVHSSSLSPSSTNLAKGDRVSFLIVEENGLLTARHVKSDDPPNPSRSGGSLIDQALEANRREQEEKQIVTNWENRYDAKLRRPIADRLVDMPDSHRPVLLDLLGRLKYDRLETVHLVRGPGLDSGLRALDPTYDRAAQYLSRPTEFGVFRKTEAERAFETYTTYRKNALQARARDGRIAWKLELRSGGHIVDESWTVAVDLFIGERLSFLGGGGVWGTLNNFVSACAGRLSGPNQR